MKPVRCVPLGLAAPIAACANTARIEGPWRHYPASPDRAHAVAREALRDFGYDLREDEVQPGGFRLVAESEDAQRAIRQVLEARPAGEECELRIRTELTVYREDPRPVGGDADRLLGRGSSAHDRLLGRIENALR